MAFGTRGVGSAAAQADVELNVNLGKFRADIGEARDVYEGGIRAMSSESIKLALATEKVERALARYPADSAQVARAELARRKVLDEVTASTKRLEAETARASNTFGGLPRKLEGLTGGLGGMRGAASLASASLIGAGGLTFAVKQALDAGSALNEQMSRSRVVFGDAADAVEEWSSRSVDAVALTRTEALRASSDFGGLLTVVGQTPAKAAEMSQALVQLAADMSSFQDVPVAETLAAIRSGLVGEAEPLRRFQVLLNAAAVEQEALTETGKASAAQLTEGEKVLARYNLILEQTAKQQGDLARTSDSYANQTRTLNARVEDLQANLGRLATPIATEGVKALNDLTTAAMKLGDALDDLANFRMPDFSGTPTPPALTVPGRTDKPTSGNPVLDRIFNPIYDASMDALRWAGLAPPDYGFPGVAGNVPDPSGGLSGLTPDGKPGAKRPPFGGVPLAELQAQRAASLQRQALKASLNDYLSDDLRVAKAIEELTRERLEFLGEDDPKYNEVLGMLAQARDRVKSLQAEIARARDANRPNKPKRPKSDGSAGSAVEEGIDGAAGAAGAGLDAGIRLAETLAANRVATQDARVRFLKTKAGVTPTLRDDIAAARAELALIRSRKSQEKAKTAAWYELASEEAVTLAAINSLVEKREKNLESAATKATSDKVRDAAKKLGIKFGGPGAGGPTDTDDLAAAFRRSSFEFLGQLQGFTNQFGSNFQAPKVGQVTIENHWPTQPSDMNQWGIWQRHAIERTGMVG